MNRHFLVLFLGLAIAADACTGSLAEPNHPPDGGMAVDSNQDASVQEASSADAARAVGATQAPPSADAAVPAPGDAATVAPDVDAMTVPTTTRDAGCGAGGVSLSSDVMPIFQNSCTLTSVCHGQIGNAAEENLYLGANAGGTPPSTVFHGLVSVRSQEDPLMNLVTPGDADSSFLWHKVIGDMNTNSLVVSGCAQASMPCVGCTMGQPCGVQQPYLGASLQARDLCTIETWIDEGAQNN